MARVIVSWLLRPLAAVIIGLALLPLVLLAGRGAEARDCRDETPLPADARLTTPGADVPSDAARFAGVWVGPWKETSGDTVCATLVVEEVLPTGHARVVYSHGPWEPFGLRLPMYWRASGRVVDGELRFPLPLPDRPAMAYRFTGNTLAGTFRGAGQHAGRARSPGGDHLFYTGAMGRILRGQCLPDTVDPRGSRLRMWWLRAGGPFRPCPDLLLRASVGRASKFLQGA